MIWIWSDQPACDSTNVTILFTHTHKRTRTHTHSIYSIGTKELTAGVLSMCDGLQIKKQIRPQTNMVPLQRHPKCRARKSCKGTCSEWNQLSRNKCNSLQYLYMDFEKHIDHIDHSHLLAGFYPWILKLLTTKCLAEAPAGNLFLHGRKTSSRLPLSCLAASTQFEAMQLVKNKIKS